MQLQSKSATKGSFSLLRIICNFLIYLIVQVITSSMSGNFRAPTGQPTQTDILRPEIWKDRLGVTISVICMFHCILTPLVFLGVPYIASHSGEALTSDLWHPIFLILVPAIAIFALWPGWKRHHDNRVWWFAAWGLFFLCAGVSASLIGGAHSETASSQGGIELIPMSSSAPFHHAQFPELVESVVTIVGSIFFIRAHLLNRKLIGCSVPLHGGSCGSTCNHEKPRLELEPKIG